MTYDDAQAAREADDQADYIDILKAERERRRAEVEVVRRSLAESMDTIRALRAEVDSLRAVIADGIDAFRLTKEYVNVPDENGFVLLPDIPGWSHFDWTQRAARILAMFEEER